MDPVANSGAIRPSQITHYHQPKTENNLPKETQTKLDKFNKILDAEIKKAEESQFSNKTKIQASHQINTQDLQNSYQKEEVGTDIAYLKQLRDFSKDFEKYLLASMWRAAYSSVKDQKDSNFTDLVYSGEYMDKLVHQAYGDELGPLAEAFYEKLVLEYGQQLKGQLELEEKSKNEREKRKFHQEVSIIE